MKKKKVIVLLSFESKLLASIKKVSGYRQPPEDTWHKQSFHQHFSSQSGDWDFSNKTLLDCNQSQMTKTTFSSLNAYSLRDLENELCVCLNEKHRTFWTLTKFTSFGYSLYSALILISSEVYRHGKIAGSWNRFFFRCCSTKWESNFTASILSSLYFLAI